MLVFTYRLDDALVDNHEYSFLDCKNYRDEQGDRQADEQNESESSVGSCDNESSTGVEGMEINQEALDHSYLAVISNRDGGSDHLVHDITTEEVIRPEVHSIFNNACIIPIDVIIRMTLHS